MSISETMFKTKQENNPKEAVPDERYSENILKVGASPQIHLQITRFFS